MVQWVKEKPEALWRTNTIWSFRNAAKIYGSPWLDAVMKNPVKSIDPELVKDYLKMCLRSENNGRTWRWEDLRRFILPLL